MIVSAFVIAELIAGSFSCGQFELLVGRMFAPLNVGSSTVCGSAKSFCQPTLGQIATCDFGTLQNFEYIVSRGTARRLILKPSCWSVLSATSATFFWLLALSVTISKGVPPPVYLPGW